MKVLSVRLNEREAAELRALCERTGLTPSKAVKRGIAEIAGTAAGRKTLGEVARELDLAGCFSGPPDLGERHDHYLRRALRGKRAKGHR
jgi:hypothetical protein